MAAVKDKTWRIHTVGGKTLDVQGKLFTNKTDLCVRDELTDEILILVPLARVDYVARLSGVKYPETK